jgi:predicted hydrolase (HD superfamily)
MKNIKDQIKEILYGTERDVARLVNHIECDTDFFEAPASTKHHLAKVGGLAEHSLSVYENMIKLNDEYKLDIPSHQIAITGLLHDLCKTNYYRLEHVPVDNGGEIVRYEDHYVVEDQLPLGHGEKSLYLISKYLRLSAAEAAAIRWHMGCWTPGIATDISFARSFNLAVEKYPLVSLLITADYFSTRLLEE